MSAIAIDVSELGINVNDLLARLKRNQEIIITSSNHPVAKITAVNEPELESTTTGRRQSGLTKGAAWMSPDFNEPLDDFAEYMP